MYVFLEVAVSISVQALRVLHHSCQPSPVNCCWPSPSQWLLVSSPTGFTTIHRSSNRSENVYMGNLYTRKKLPALSIITRLNVNITPRNYCTINNLFYHM
jgi:hypothetical protein